MLRIFLLLIIIVSGQAWSKSCRDLPEDLSLLSFESLEDIADIGKCKIAAVLFRGENTIKNVTTSCSELLPLVQLDNVANDAFFAFVSPSEAYLAGRCQGVIDAVKEYLRSNRKSSCFSKDEEAMVNVFISVGDDEISLNQLASTACKR